MQPLPLLMALGVAVQPAAAPDPASRVDALFDELARLEQSRAEAQRDVSAGAAWAIGAAILGAVGVAGVLADDGADPSGLALWGAVSIGGLGVGSWVAMRGMGRRHEADLAIQKVEERLAALTDVRPPPLDRSGSPDDGG